MNKDIWWAWALKNSISIVCWTILAIYFNKWWIALYLKDDAHDWTTLAIRERVYKTKEKLVI